MVGGFDTRGGWWGAGLRGAMLAGCNMARVALHVGYVDFLLPFERQALLAGMAPGSLLYYFWEIPPGWPIRPLYWPGFRHSHCRSLAASVLDPASALFALMLYTIANCRSRI